MEEIKKLIENREMGFISTLDFLMTYYAILRSLGAHKCLEDKMCEILEDFEGDIIHMLKTGNATNNQIEAHGTGTWT